MPPSIYLALDPELAQDGGSDFLDRLAGRVDAADAFGAHQLLRLLDLEAAVLQVGVAAVGTPLLADLAQALRGYGEAVEAGFMRPERLGELHPVEILRDERVVRGFHAELQRHV